MAITSRQRRITAALVVFTVGGSAGLAWGLSDTGSTASRFDDPSYRAAPISSLPANEAGAFRVLASASQGADTQLAGSIGFSGLLQAKFAPNPALARPLLVGSPLPGRRPWVIPGRDSLCLYLPDAEGAGMTCATTAEATAGRLYLASITSDGTATVVGVVPNGVRTITVSRGGSAERAVPVVDNAFSFQTQGPTTMTINGLVTPVPTPPGRA
jgi:hypothetical protein